MPQKLGGRWTKRKCECGYCLRCKGLAAAKRYYKKKRDERLAAAAK